MKYYAVTEDPNELFHYGRLGMKWGQHIFGDKTPKSPAYKRAASKLRASASKKVKAVKSAAKKSSTQRAFKRQQKQEAKFNKAVQKAQRRLTITENLHNLDVAKAYERSLNREYKEERKANRAAERTARKYARNERKMQKYTQQAREGRLRYGKLSENQVQRVTDRLALERSARVLGSTEKPKFRTRMKDAVQEGLLKGTVEGMAAGMREVAIAKVQNRLKNKRVLDKKSKQQAKREHDASRIKNKKSKAELREDVKQEAYEELVKSGANVFKRAVTPHRSTANAAKLLKKAEGEKQKNLEAKERQKAFEKTQNALYSAYVLNKENDNAKTMLERIQDTDARNKFLGNNVPALSITKIRKKSTEDTRAKQESQERKEREKRIKIEQMDATRRLKEEEKKKAFLDKVDRDLEKQNTALSTNVLKPTLKKRKKAMAAMKRGQVRVTTLRRPSKPYDFDDLFPGG